MTIEDIILDRDRRGISKLRPHLPSNFATEAAQLILDNPGPAIVVTGFYILDAGYAETDGPPGAVVIGSALNQLGYEVVHVTDRYCSDIMDKTGGDYSRVVEFPIVDDDASKEFAAGVIDDVKPSVVIAIERCGLTDEGKYRNMRGRDISDYNARIDHMRTELGARLVMLEGGPTLNGECFRAGVVDELFLTLGGVVVGGHGLPTAVETPGVEVTRESVTRLELLAAVPNPETDEVYLRYRVRR